MRIGIYTPYLDTLTGGEKYILSIASCLSQNAKVDVFWDTDDAASFKDKAQKKVDIDLSSISIVPNIFSQKVSFISRLLRSKDYDTIFFLSDGSIPIVLSKLIVHFQFPVEWVKDSPLMHLKIQRARWIICNSLFTKRYIDNKFGVNSKIVYPPVVEIGKGLKKENIILNVGRFGKSLEGSYFKKQDFLIQVFSEMIKNGLNNWKLIFAISVRDEDSDKFIKLKELAKGLPVEFLENINNQELKNTYKKAKIYWHASGYGEDLEKYPEKAEHFGISTVEAMSAGVVPVVIQAGGQPEIVTNGENGFLWQTKEELIKKTQEVIENKNILQELSKKAYERSSDFTGDRFCKEITSLMNL